MGETEGTNWAAGARPLPHWPHWLRWLWCLLAHRRYRQRFPRYLDDGYAYCSRCRRWWE